MSDQGRTSTVESTPVSTPVSFASHARKVDRERDLYLPWHRKSRELGGENPRLNPDSPLLESESEDYSFPLFVQSPPAGAYDLMDDLTSLMDSTATNGRPSSSPAPPNKTSNLTSALQGAEGRDRQAPIEMDVDGVGTNGWSGPLGAGRHDSFSGGMSGVGSQAAPGAKPISVKNPNRERPRRESVAGSMVGGMSWGGISVGSWIRDEYVGLLAPIL